MSMSDLKSIYRKKAMEVHPDQSGKDGSEFRDVNNAWSELKSYAFA
jgi:curved DNA-binding protein CbpA